jgi:transcriptional regulator with XRE-family HTH domain
MYQVPIVGTLLSMAEDSGRNRSALTLAVAAQIRAERAASGLTQRQVMEKSGIPKSTYLRLESGERVADVQQLAAFCAAVDISLADLMRHAEERVARTAEPARDELMAGLSPRNQRIVEETRTRPKGRRRNSAEQPPDNGRSAQTG